MRRRNAYLRRDDDAAAARVGALDDAPAARDGPRGGRGRATRSRGSTCARCSPRIRPSRTRRTLLGLQARVADLLLARESSSAAERRAIEDALDGEVELLWLTAEVRQDRPTVLDEVSTVLWYLETRLLDASARAHDALVRAFEEEFGARPTRSSRLAVPLRSATGSAAIATAIRSSRPTITLAAARRASHAILGRYRARRSTS